MLSLPIQFPCHVALLIFHLSVCYFHCLLYTKLYISFVYFCHSRVQFHILFSHLILGREIRCSYNISLSENVITYTSLCSPCFLVYLMAISQLYRLYSLKWKTVRNQLWPILSYSSSICLENWRKVLKHSVRIAGPPYETWTQYFTKRK
jgi:hypothetical protein